MRSFRIFLFFGILFPLFAFAKADLLLWKPTGYKYSYVIPQIDEEKPAQALKRYLSTLENNPELKEFANSLKAANTAASTIKPFSTATNKPAVLAIANDTDDLTKKADRAAGVLSPLEKRGANTFLTPVAATSGLSESDAAEFRGKINSKFDLLVAMGGDDIHPSLYNDPDSQKLTVNTNLSRDKEELAIVRSYMEEGKGLFAGICRGDQMGGVAANCKLVKDIKSELHLDHPVGTDHGIVMQETNEGILTRRIFGNDTKMTVNSFHHEAVKIPSTSNPKIRVTATAENQSAISEVAEYYNGRGIGVQSHPELMPNTAYHERFYDLLFDEARLVHSRRVSAPFRNIDLDKTLFGIEYTFQDQGMVDEPGRMTFETPHKRERFEIFKKAYMKNLGVGENSLEPYGEADFKPGETIKVPNDGKHVMDMEPVSIEVNTTPKLFHEIEPAGEKIFSASKKASLVAYVNPAAERSGMGHIHVGAKRIGDSPYYKNPNLLRNEMVYEMKHPSLLWGFAEAYDIGARSNIETYHSAKRQAAFKKAVDNFDQWYLKKIKAKADTSDGLRQFLRFLKEQDTDEIGFFEHYRFKNLEHLEKIANSPRPIDPNMTGKFTVETRNRRPPKSPKHAKASAELSLSVMDRNAEPGFLEPFEPIDSKTYDRFHSTTKVAADWEIVKRDLPRHNPLWDEMVGEYVDVHQKVDAIQAALPNKLAAEIRPAFSRKGEKGTKFEIRIPVDVNEAPKIDLAGKKLEFEKVQMAGKDYWLSVFQTGGTKKDFTPEVVRNLNSAEVCEKWFSSIH